MKIIIITTLFIGVLVSTFAQNRSIKFIDNSIDKAIEKAQKTDKLIFVDAYTTWCGPCKWMAANMFTNDTVADFYNENFINLKLNMEKGDGKEFAKTHSIRFYPTLLFINKNGELFHKQVGTMRAPHSYVDLGKNAKNPKENLVGMYQRFTGGEKSQEFIEKYLKVLKSAYEPTDEVLNIYYKGLSEDQFLNPETFDIITLYDKSVDSKAMTYILEHRDEVKSAYPEQVGEFLYRNHESWVMEQVSGKQADRKEMEKRMIAVKKRNIPGWQKIILTIDLKELQKEKRMDEFCEIAAADVGQYFADDHYALNNFAWTVFENTDNKEYLLEAINWTDIVIAKLPNPGVLDTKANLLFKVDRKEEAIKVQTEAIELGKENGMPDIDLKDYQDTLKKFKK
ncbi:MAG: thiol-disulfide isomerase/thioredoxin [Salibacteraceae bacterium]|jgi:thiol-disulfide isomerase/thioredoxin